MKKIFTLLIVVTFSPYAFGQSNFEKFKSLLKKNDTTKIKTLIEKWETTNPNDPDLYASAFSYYFSNSKKEVLSLGNLQNGSESLEITDSTGKVAGYLNSGMFYFPDKLSKAMHYADLGIEKFPNRLDIRFGKCYVLQEIEDYDNFSKEIIKIVKYSVVNGNNWLWTKDEKVEDGKSTLLKNIHTYLKNIYDTEDDNLLPYMIQIGGATLEYYKTVEILSITSVALMLSKDYDQAIEYLLLAEKLNPKDFIVLNNIAHAYKLKGDKTTAIKYYELAERYGDDQSKKFSRKSIEELQK